MLEDNFSYRNRLHPPLNKITKSDTPAFLMNAPFSLGFDQPNNATMKSLSTKERQLDLEKAIDQFQVFYSFMAEHGLVYLLPSASDLQDQTYVSNVAAYLPHIEAPTVILSIFRSEPRIGEESVAKPFLEMLGYQVHRAPQYFEGEADLKHLQGNVYFGAHGMRTSINALDWMEDVFEMKVIPIEVTDPHAYHLDCILFPISKDNTLACIDLINSNERAEIERHTNIIDISYCEAMAMATNCIRIKNQLAAQTNISIYKQTDDAYAQEKAKISKLETICSSLNLNLNLFDLSEFRKSGAALSCFVMKLNNVSAIPATRPNEAI